MMKKRILLIITLLTVSFSYSQEWELIAETDDGQQTFMRPHTENSAWFKIIPYQVPTDFVKQGMDKTTEGYIIQLKRFDCDLKKIGTLVLYYYDKDGNVKYSEETKEVLVKMSYAVPETVGEFWVNKFCEID